MPNHSDSPFITHAPIVNRHGTVAGAHFLVHTFNLPLSALVSTLNSLNPVWLAADALALVEFVGLDSAQWISGWQPRAGTGYVTDNAAVATDPDFVALDAAAPTLCVRSDDLPEECRQAVGYLLTCPATFEQFANQRIDARLLPLIALKVESLSEHVKAMSIGAGHRCFRTRCGNGCGQAEYFVVGGTVELDTITGGGTRVCH